MSEVKQHWEDQYAERDRIWSGHVNHWLPQVVGPLPPGRAMDLGCGEGGDALWLAERGWQVVGVDISDTALGRAAAESARRGVADRVQLRQMNLSDDFPDGVYDLVSAQFLQSMVHLDRERIFAAAARAVAPGGVLMVVDHGAAPPWAPPHIHEHVFPGVEEVLATIDLGEGLWERLRVATAERDAVGPDGQPGTLTDNVIVLRRGHEVRADGPSSNS